MKYRSAFVSNSSSSSFLLETQTLTKEKIHLIEDFFAMIDVGDSERTGEIITRKNGNYYIEFSYRYRDILDVFIKGLEIEKYFRSCSSFEVPEKDD